MTSDVGRANATACATLVDEWVRCGLRHAVIAPGSRSTPMALSLAARDEVAVHVVHDERVAGFVALGLGIGGVPAALLCTSGTAAANFHPAVVEAGLSEIPLLVLTADRPPELRGVGASQTIDQLELYGRSVRWFHDAAVPDEADPAEWRPLAQRAITTAGTGPVHVNLPFREPLVGAADTLPEPIGEPSPVPRGIAMSGPVPAAFDLQRGVIVVGSGHRLDTTTIEQLAVRLGWPLLADPTSGCRASVNSVAHADSLLRHAGFAADHAPELVIRIGRPPLSKVLTQWIVSSGAPLVQVGGPGVVDPDHNVVRFCGIDDLDGLRGAASTPWLARWRHADRLAEKAIEATLNGRSLTEPGVARTIANWLPGDFELVVAASMPIRDLEWFGGHRARCHFNRGANGIDGVLSTALGRALSRRSTVAWLGDIAFVHDSNALIGVTGRDVDLRVVVTDNDGGGIFSFLPQRSALDAARFEQLFGTPHGTDIAALGTAHGVPVRRADTADELVDQLESPGPCVIRVESDRDRNVAIHAELNAAVAAALPI